jgi:hypothetical protein
VVVDPHHDLDVEIVQPDVAAASAMSERRGGIDPVNVLVRLLSEVYGRFL